MLAKIAPGSASNQAARVNVDVFREQARSYKRRAARSHCRSELAREERPGTEIYQVVRLASSRLQPDRIPQWVLTDVLD